MSRGNFQQFKEYGNMKKSSILDDIAAISQKSILVYGGLRQQRKLSEECGELIAAINQHHDGRITEQELAEEVADVEVCIYHMREMITHELVDSAKEMKLKRLAFNLGMEI